MATHFKPDGYTSVSPYLIVNDAARVIDFMIAALGAKEIRRFPDKTGRLGATSVREPVKQEDDDKHGGVKDPEGTTTWWIATKVT